MIGPYFSVYEIIEQSLQLLGAAAYGEGLDPYMQKTALTQMNTLLQKWSTNYMNYTVFDQFVQTSANKQFISMGSAVNGEFSQSAIGDISARPASVEQVDIIMGTLTFPVTIKSYQEYTKLPIKNVTSIPTNAYFQEGMPFSYLWFYPMVPQGYSVRVVGKAYLPQYQSTSQAVILPPEYNEALIFNLALVLAPIFGQDAPIGLITNASSALSHIKTRNVLANIPRLNNDFRQNGSKNFWAGTV